MLQLDEETVTINVSMKKGRGGRERKLEKSRDARVLSNKEHWSKRTSGASILPNRESERERERELLKEEENRGEELLTWMKHVGHHSTGPVKNGFCYRCAASQCFIFGCIRSASFQQFPWKYDVTFEDRISVRCDSGHIRRNPQRRKILTKWVEKNVSSTALVSFVESRKRKKKRKKSDSLRMANCYKCICIALE